MSEDTKDAFPPPPPSETMGFEAMVRHAKTCHVFVGMPCYGCRLTSKTMTAILQFQAFCLTHGIKLSVDFMGNESLITRARSIMAERFLRSKATHLLFVDADVSFTPASVLRLLSYPKADVTAGIYAKKGLDWGKIGQRTHIPPAQRLLNFNINMVAGRAQHAVDNGFVEVYDAATGFFCIKRQTLETLRKAYWKDRRVKNDIPGSRDQIDEYCALFDTHVCPDSRRYLSEDYFFCRLCQEQGLKVYADITCPLTHTGSMHYGPGKAVRRCKTTYIAQIPAKKESVETP